MKTPWGSSQHIEKIAHGLTFVSTVSHGGFKVSPTLNMKIPNWLKQCSHNKLGLEGWYEEDCDWCIPVLVYHNDFSAWANIKEENNFLELAEATFNRYLLKDIKTPLVGELPKKKGLYLSLYHERNDSGKKANNPLIGPLTKINVTSPHAMVLCFCDGLDALRYGLCRDLPELTTKEDCLEYSGILYRDWSIEYHQGMIT